MTEEKLLNMISSGETFTVEFKGEDKIQLSDNELYKAVVCLANGNGGFLLIGVEDDGRVTGAKARHGRSTDPLRLKAAISNNTVPNIQVEIKVMHIEEKAVIVIEVLRSDRPICTAGGLYLRRDILGTGKPGCLPFYAHEMESRKGKFGLSDLTAQQVNSAKWDDLEPLEFERLRRIIKQYQGDKSSGCPSYSPYRLLLPRSAYKYGAAVSGEPDNRIKTE